MLRTLLVLSVFVPGFLMALRDRFVALQLYLWFAFFRPQDWMWFDVTSLRLSMLLGLVLLVPAIATGLWPNLSHPLSIGTAMFVGSALLAQFNAVNQEMGWIWIDFLVRLTLICLLTVTLVTDEKKLIRLIAVIAGSLGFHAAKAGVASLVGGGVRFADGLTGAFADNNGYALGTVMIMPLLLVVGLNAHLLFDDNKRLTQMARWGFLAAVPLCAFTVISTFSRGGFLAMAAMGLVYMSLHQRRIRLSLAGSGLVVLVLTFAPIPEGYFDRLETISTYEEVQDDSAISRTHFWQVAARMADAKPLGVGLRNFESTYDAYDFTYGRYGVKRAVHSSHFQVLAEQGYLGTAIWLGQFALAFAVALRIRRRASIPGMPAESSKLLVSVSNCLVSSMCGFLVGGSFLALALNDISWLTFALLAATDRFSAAWARDLTGSPSRPTATPPRITPVPWKPWRPVPVAAQRSAATAKTPA